MGPSSRQPWDITVTVPLWNTAHVVQSYQSQCPSSAITLTRARGRVSAARCCCCTALHCTAAADPGISPGAQPLGWRPTLPVATPRSGGEIRAVQCSAVQCSAVQCSGEIRAAGKSSNKAVNQRQSLQLCGRRQGLIRAVRSCGVRSRAQCGEGPCGALHCSVGL
jgi:hypothetical protein